MKVIGAILLLGFIAYFFWFATVGAGKSLGKKNKCPRCHKYGMHSKGTHYYLNGKHASDWKCPYCGHIFTKIGM